jgi:hypothetical protein
MNLFKYKTITFMLSQKYVFIVVKLNFCSSKTKHFFCWCLLLSEIFEIHIFLRFVLLFKSHIVLGTLDCGLHFYLWIQACRPTTTSSI